MQLHLQGSSIHDQLWAGVQMSRYVCHSQVLAAVGDDGTCALWAWQRSHHSGFLDLPKGSVSFSRTGPLHHLTILISFLRQLLRIEDAWLTPLAHSAHALQTKVMQRCLLLTEQCAVQS